MFFLSQPSVLLKLHSHPTQHQIMCIRGIRVFLQLVHKPTRGMPVRREGRRTMVLMTQYVIIVVCLTTIL
jgi:hypothetical protein